MKLKLPLALATSTAAGALLVAAPAAAAPTAPSSVQSCTSDYGVSPSPSVGGKRTYNANVAGYVTLTRTHGRYLKVVSAVARSGSGYTPKVLTASGLRIKVAFIKSGQTVYFGASTGNTRPERLHWNVTICS